MGYGYSMNMCAVPDMKGWRYPENYLKNGRIVDPITNVGAGQGLLKVGSSLVPFVNKFPRNTELYKLMTTKFGEV